VKYIHLFTILALILLFAACSKDTTDNNQVITTEDLLVRNNEITGWVYGGERWMANNITELTTYINGLADVFQRYGFVEAAHQSYEGQIDNENRRLQLTIYKQQDEANAQAVYEDPDIGLGSGIQWQNGAGEEAKYIRFGMQALVFYSGQYFVYLQINYDTEESLIILKQFALNVDQKI
jgi:hypothetical protein